MFLKGNFSIPIIVYSDKAPTSISIVGKTTHCEIGLH